MNNFKKFKNAEKKEWNSKRIVILGVSILFVALLVFLVIFIINKSKDVWAGVIWYGVEKYQISEENGKSVIYHPDSGFKFSIPLDWSWSTGLGDFFAYFMSPDTTFQNSSLLRGCYILISVLDGTDFYSGLIEKIQEIKESSNGFIEEPNMSREIIKVAGTEGLYSKYFDGKKYLSFINIPLNQSNVLRIKVFYPPEREEREKCNNAFLEIINKAERV